MLISVIFDINQIVHPKSLIKYAFLLYFLSIRTYRFGRVVNKSIKNFDGVLNKICKTLKESLP